VYAKAVRMRERLEARPQDKRRASDYKVLILAFHAVYRLDPAYSKTPVALTDIAELYREMGQVFSEKRYAQDSIQAYQFLAHEYPSASLSRQGMLTIGEIYLEDLDDPAQARKAYADFLKAHPHSGETAQAKAQLVAIDRLLEQRAQTPAVTGITAEDQGAPGQMSVVTAVRDWVGPHYTRIVIALTGEAKFETQRLSNPDRIVLDLPDTHLSRALAGMKFPVETGFLRSVRVGQFKPNVTRVVLDVEKVENYFVFSLPNPFRLVVDVHGPEPAPKAEVAKVAPPPPPAPKAAAPETPKSPLANGTPPAGRAARAPSRPETAEAGPPALEVTPARPTANGARTLTRALGLKISKIVIDPGHGGHDTGTIGPTGLEEKDVVLDVSNRLAKLLREDTGSDVILTRSTDVFIPLEERTAIANEKGSDLFISVHANASRDRQARGIETYYLNFTTDPGALAVAARENATSQESVHELRDLIKKIALTEKVEESQEFARDVQHAMLSQLDKDGDPQHNRGVRKAPFVVLIGANMPSILCEISFLSNPHDERLLRRASYRESIAEALEKGVERYMSTLGGIRVAQRGKTPATP
jgi:N-acetylmuramoyl-L-alanine amidase